MRDDFDAYVQARRQALRLTPRQMLADLLQVTLVVLAACCFAIGLWLVAPSVHRFFLSLGG